MAPDPRPDGTSPPPARPAAPETGADDGGLMRRILPRSILGLAGLLFFMSLASAFSGAALFAYYRFELDDTRERVADVESSIADDVIAAEQVIEAEREETLTEIEQLLAELEQFAASSLTVTEVLDGVRDSIFLVTSLDPDGQPSVGTAFVLFSDSERSFLLTSYQTVRAATVQPGPGIEVRGTGGQPVGVSLTGWDEGRDLALLVAEDAPNLPAVTLADPSALRPGDRIFAVSALGGSGGSVVQGQVADVASNAVQHDAQIGPQFQGGPLLNGDGELVAISSRRYAPLGFVPDSVFFGIPVRQACEQVVQCPTNLTG